MCPSSVSMLDSWANRFCNLFTAEEFVQTMNENRWLNEWTYKFPIHILLPKLCMKLTFLKPGTSTDSGLQAKDCKLFRDFGSFSEYILTSTSLVAKLKIMRRTNKANCRGRLNIFFLKKSTFRSVYVCVICENIYIYICITYL